MLHSFLLHTKWFGYLYIHILFIFFSIIVYDKILDRVPCAIQ